MAWNNAGSVAAVAQGNNAFVGTSTLFLGAFVGDTFLYQDGSTALWLSEITAIADNTHLTTLQNWPYAGLTVGNGKWSIQPTSPLRQSTATVNDLLVTLNANFASVYSLTTSDQYGTLNKAASSNNNGHYFTTAGAAVARAGTFGDDAYRIGMSKVGGGYNDAIVIDKTSALVSVFGDPTAALGIATKQYVDAAGGAKKVRAISTANITISSPGSTIGGVTPSVGERFGLLGQTTAAQCGVYVYVDATHPMTRATDANAAAGMMPGLLVTAAEGTYAGVTFVLNTAAPIVVGTTSLAFAQLPTLGLNIFTGNQRINAKLGIGIDPTNMFDVYKSQNANTVARVFNDNSGAAASAAVLLDNGTSSAAFQHFGNTYTTSSIFRQNGTLVHAGGAGGLTFNTGVTQPIYFAINSVEVSRLGSDGSFLIGTTTNGGYLGLAKLEAKQSASSSVAISGWGAAPGTDAFDARVDATSGNLMTMRYNGNTVVGTITTNGTATTYGTSSDERLKNFDVQQRDLGAMIDAIMVKDAEFISQPGDRVLSVSAQQTASVGYVEAVVYPQNVVVPQRNAAGDILYDGDGEIKYREETQAEAEGKTWIADYGRFGVLALWGVKDLRARVSELEGLVAALRTEVDELKAA